MTCKNMLEAVIKWKTFALVVFFTLNANILLLKTEIQGKADHLDKYKISQKLNLTF